jgi:hypothetical protein
MGAFGDGFADETHQAGAGDPFDEMGDHELGRLAGRRLTSM